MRDPPNSSRSRSRCRARSADRSFAHIPSPRRNAPAPAGGNVPVLHSNRDKHPDKAPFLEWKSPAFAACSSAYGTHFWRTRPLLFCHCRCRSHSHSGYCYFAPLLHSRPHADVSNRIPDLRHSETGRNCRCRSCHHGYHCVSQTDGRFHNRYHYHNGRCERCRYAAMSRRKCCNHSHCCYHHHSAHRRTRYRCVLGHKRIVRCYNLLLSRHAADHSLHIRYLSLPRQSTSFPSP